MAERVRELELGAETRLLLLIEGHVHLLNEARPGSLAHLEVEVLEPSRRRAILHKRDVYEHLYRELIQEGMETGVFRPVDAKVATLAILGALTPATPPRCATRSSST